MINTSFMSSLAYIAIFEEWYVLLKGDHYDAWPIFQGKTTEEKWAIAKQYLEQIIDDVHVIFPGIPTVIAENNAENSGWIYPPPPSNLDVLGIDQYYIPTSSDCSPAQRTKFIQEVFNFYDPAAAFGKPIMMIPPSFINGPWRMLSECQMQWYSDLALIGRYNIESILWFHWANVGDTHIGVRNFPDLVNRQKIIACQVIDSAHCIANPRPADGPVFYTVNLQANNGQYVVAEGGGGGVVNANRDEPGPWETFSLVDINGGELISGDPVGFTTHANYYLRAESGGGSTMDATSQQLGPWELFFIESINGQQNIANDTQLAIRTWNGQHFAVAESGGGDVVAANRTAPGPWETFTVKIR